MIEGISDFRATGIFTTIGGPACICLCIANYLGKVKINWYWLVPFIQAYILMAIYITLFGLRYTIPFHQTALFIVCGSTLTSTILCHTIKMNTAYNKPRRIFPTTLRDFSLKVIGNCLVTFSASLLIVYAAYISEDCLSDFRCRMYSHGSGFPGYSGSLLFPMLLSGLGATWVYFAIFAMLPMEEKSDGLI